MVNIAINRISPPLVLSLVGHTLLFILLFDNVMNPPYQQMPINSASNPIKSYLYSAPKIKTQVPNVESLETINKSNIHSDNHPPAKTNVNPVSEIPPALTPTKPSTKYSKIIRPAIDQDKKNNQVISPITRDNKLLSPQEHLAELRASIVEQDSIVHKYSSQNPSKNNPNLSVFNPEPTLVPKSKNSESLDERIEKNTTRYSDDIEIIKHDNGTCSIKQDLSSVGMEGVTALQYFACGQTKIEKAFSAHMKAFQQKLR